MKKLLIVLFSAALLLLFPACAAQSEQQLRLEQCQSELEQLKNERDTLEVSMAELREQLSELRAGQPTPEEQKILDDLTRHTELIPLEPTLGGTFRFYPGLSKLLNGKYAYAYAEDGHMAAELILQYTINGDGTISWKLALYDIGDGWKLPQP